MRAASLEQLFSHQEQIEEAVAAYLSSRGVPCLTARSLDDYSDTQQVVVIFIPGAATGHKAPPTVTNTGNAEYDWFTGVLQIRIMTGREDEGPSGVQGIVLRHAGLIAKVRAAMLQGRVQAHEPKMSYLTLLDLQFAGTDQSIGDDQTIDESTLTYTVTYAINPGAWPLTS